MIIISILLAFIFFYRIFFGYFFMDDWYFLQVNRANSWVELIQIFEPVKNIPYRPISQQLFYLVSQKIFGLNPLPYHVVILAIHMVNSLLVDQIVKQLGKQKATARLLSLMYLVSALHFVGVFSITGSYFVIGMLFSLLSIKYWLKFRENKKLNYYFFSLVLFVLGVFSAEVAASLLFIFFILYPKRKTIIHLLPFIFIVCSNLLINYFIAGAPKTAAFNLRLSAFPSVFKWYLLRALGLPEGVKNGYQWEKSIIYIGFIALMGILIISLWKNKAYWLKKYKKLFTNIMWVLIGALPFYFLPNHLNPIYFSLAFVGFLLLINQILSDKLLFAYAIIYIFISFFSVHLLFHTHWTVRRSNLAKEWINKIRESKIKPANNTIVLSSTDKPTLDDLEITLNGDRAMQLFFNNNQLKTIYAQNK